MNLRLASLPLAVLLWVPGEAQTRITAVRFWSLGEVTRVAIETDAEAQYKSERLEQPDRIYFDLEGVRPQSRNLETIPVGDRVVKQIRIARPQIGVARVVLDVTGPADYNVSQLTNPHRIMVEVRLAGAAPAAPPIRSVTGGRAIEEEPSAAAVTPEPVKPAPSKPEPPKPAPPAQVAVLNPAPSRSVEVKPAPVRPAEVKPVETAVPTETRPAAAAKPDVEPPRRVEAKPPETPRPTAARATPPIERPRVAEADPLETPRATAARPEPPLARPPETAAAAKRDSRGDRSLIRALGLKLGRVVLDPGHGGHDTGSVGPGGLMEKDLVLDVAKRLGALITRRLGSEVVYTREDDTFVPLEERTALANQRAADLFLSLHANSSRAPGVDGVETFYLNFTTSASALEVAARENASSQKSIHELQSLLQKIALKEKVQESREFAAAVQRGLYSGLSRGRRLKNRGVKQAPFVVLIGAQMPSVLAEIAFISNRSEETLLKRSDYRQRIAESLYRGVSQYANTLSHFYVAKSQGSEGAP
jgi:N-acetylmuramoyl-L-alanine amidase